jgi:hypothetical protein
MLMHSFSCSGGTGTDLTQSAQGHVMPNMCFCIRWDLWVTRSSFQCIWGAKRRRTICHARVRPVRISQKAHRDTLCATCVFASSGICGTRSAFRCIQGMKCQRTIFSCSGRTGMDSTKSALAHIMPNMCFCIRWDLWVT